MAEYTIDKIEYGDNVYKLQDSVSGYVTGNNVVPYLTCGTAAGTVAKTTTLVTGTLPTTLTTGTRVAVRFTNSNTASNPTITIGSYGAIAIKRYGTTAPSTSAATSWNAGNVITLVYDGTYWLMADWTSPNTTYSEISEANITNGSGSTTGLVTGRRAKAAVGAFESVTDVTVNGTSVVASRVAAITIPTNSGTITEVKTTAGTHSTIDVTSGVASFNVPTKTSHLTNDSGFITNAGVTSITTTAGAHTAITSATGAVSFKVPTKTSHLTNDSGFITSYTDEKLKWTASTSTNTYYPLVSTSTATTSTANTLNGINFYQYYNTAGGYRRLELGNTTANQSTGGAYGAIRLFGANATYYGDLVPGNPELGSSISGAGLSANRTWKLPDKSGTIALTSDLSSYIHKPSDDGYYGYVLKYETSSSTFWDVPNTYQFGIFEESPGTYNYYGGDMAGEIQDAAVGGRCLVLQLDLINSATDLLETYMLTDYRMQWIDTNDGAYSVLWFTDTFRIIGESLKRITVGIYLDETEVEHEYGEITVDVREIGERYTINGGDTGYTTNISTTADQFKQLAVLNLPAGKWIVTARARFTPTSSSNHYSGINIGTTTAGSGSTTTGNAVRDRRYGEGTYYNQHALTRIIALSTDAPVYLNGSGSVAGTWNRTTDAFQFDAIRIS